MVILELYQNDFSKDLVVFDSLEEGKAFVAQIPGYTLETEDEFEVEYFNPKHLPDYMEIVFNGNIVPLSRFSFNSEENVDIIWKEISNLSVKNDKVIEGATKVDAYVVNNDEVKAYVEARLALHEQIRYLKSQGKTIILSSHDIAEVETLCDRIAILNSGKIVFCGTPSELTDKVGRRYYIHLKTQEGEQSFETTNIEDSLISLLNECKQKKIQILDIKVDRGTLEEHFIKMARRESE